MGKPWENQGKTHWKMMISPGMLKKTMGKWWFNQRDMWENDRKGVISTKNGDVFSNAELIDNGNKLVQMSLN